MTTDCKVCGGSGKYPFVKDGKVIPHVLVHCQCRQDESEYPFALKPEDIDFPVSYSAYRSYSLEHGWADPGSDVPLEIEPQPKVQEVIHRHSDMGKKEFDLLQQTARKADYLEQRLDALTKPKEQPKGKPTGYKGIR